MTISANISPSALPDAVFAKTPKGREEITARSAGLRSKQRRILIVLDGQRPLHALSGFSLDEVKQAVGDLLALGMVAPARAGQDAPMPAPVQEDPAAASKLADIKALLTDSAHTYLGVMAAGVVRRVQLARDEGELLSVVGHWHMAMRESKYGREAAARFLEEVKALFDRDARPALV